MTSCTQEPTQMDAKEATRAATECRVQTVAGCQTRVVANPQAQMPFAQATRIALTLAISVMLVSVLGVSTGCSSSGGGQVTQRVVSEGNIDAEGYTHISGEEAAELIESGKGVLVDVRGQVDWDYQHIPGSIPIPFDVIATEEGQAQLPDKDEMIILYCDYGGLSKIAAEDLAAAGYTNIIEFDGLAVWDGPLEGNGV